jgi:uncharacterized protein
MRSGEWHLWVKAPPIDGKANLEVIEALARLHGVPKTAVSLVSGGASKTKTFEVAT